MKSQNNKSRNYTREDDHAFNNSSKPRRNYDKKEAAPIVVPAIAKLLNSHAQADLNCNYLQADADNNPIHTLWNVPYVEHTIVNDAGEEEYYNVYTVNRFIAMDKEDRNIMRSASMNLVVIRNSVPCYYVDARYTPDREGDNYIMVVTPITNKGPAFRKYCHKFTATI